MSEFDPRDYNFTPDGTLENIWRTFPESDWEISGYYIGCYTINKIEEMWVINEIALKNGREFEITLYRGRIPNSEFAHQLMLNLGLEVPVVQRELKINNIL